MTDASGGGGSSAGVASAEDEDTRFDAGAFGGLVSSLPMNTALSMACGDKGLSSVISFDGVVVTNTVQSPEAPRIASALLDPSVTSVFRLRPFQAEVVSRFVHMQLRTLEIQRDGTTEKFLAPHSDIGMTAINDLLTGGGKTIMSCLGSLLFSILRTEDMKKALDVEKEALTWSNRGGAVSQTSLDALPVLGPGRKIVVFANSQICEHWKRQFEIAAKMIKAMAYSGVNEWDVSIVYQFGKHAPKDSGTDVLRENEIRVYINNTSKQHRRSAPYLNEEVYHSVLIFDEVAAKEENTVCFKIKENVEAGRFIFISADLTPWIENKFTPGPKTVFKSVFEEWDNYAYDGKQSNQTTAELHNASIYLPSARSQVVEQYMEPLQLCTLYVACVKYKRSLLELVGAGIAGDLGERHACEVFLLKFGVDVSKCSTDGDLMVSIQERDSVLKSRLEVLKAADWSTPGTPGRWEEMRALERRLWKLKKLESRVKQLREDECPICFEPVESISLIQPCLHFVCKVCIAKIRGTCCPFCRQKMTVGVHLEPGPSKKQRLAVPASAPVAAEAAAAAATGTMWSAGTTGANFGEVFVNKIRSSGGSSATEGLAQALARTLETIKASRAASDDRHDTLCVMVICPGVEVSDGMFSDLGFGVTIFRTKGNRKNPHIKAAFEQKMQQFQQKDGECKILFVEDASNLEGGSNKDNMTGLDIDGLDAVVSVGRVNLAQRMGRLLRYSRTKPSAKKHALYVEIVPR